MRRIRDSSEEMLLYIVVKDPTGVESGPSNRTADPIGRVRKERSVSTKSQPESAKMTRSLALSTRSFRLSTC